jgi:predicted MPP superfamily phosphohydrolase
MNLTRLSPQEIAGTLLVSSSLAYIFASTLLLAFKRLVLKEKSRTSFSRSHDVGILIAAVVCVICLIYGLFVEPYQLDVTHIKLFSPKITTGSVRVVQISDLHCERTTRLEEQLPSVIAAEKPDLIVFTGDALNEKQGLDVFQKCVTALSKIAPTYAVDGNHDVRQFPNIKLYPGTGVTQLKGKTVEQNVRGNIITITGAPVDKESSIKTLVAALKDSTYNILLHHFPATILLLKTPDDNQLNQSKVDLLCVGHTHGGQICLPFYGAIITHSGTSKKYESGFYQVGKVTLYVNRGIGMDGGMAPRIRFLARPEITVFDIISNKQVEGK